MLTAHRGYRFGNVHGDPVCLELSLRDSPATMVTPWKTIDEQSVAHGAAEPADLTKQHRFPRPGERGRSSKENHGTQDRQLPRICRSSSIRPTSKHNRLNPSPMDANVRLHWNTTTHKEIVAQYESIYWQTLAIRRFSAYTSGTKRIPGTAIVADPSKQTRATVPVTHYFDLERSCRDCKRHFIFFAEEQKYWYEELGFGLESDCVRCTECRKKQQGIAWLKERYESLFHIEPKSAEEKWI